jgi:putative Mg2+ transporter-C (MgtC) family protein
MLVRLLLGALIGGIIGFERQVHGRPAGLRTHILVCIASVLLMIVSEYYHYLSVLDPGYVRADPGRIAAGAITGIGFLGAGVVLKTGFSIQGLTTAASIWVVSAIGLSIGSGLYFPGIITFLVTILTLTLLRALERKAPKLTFRFLTIEADNSITEEEITSILKGYGASINNVNYETRTQPHNESVFHITFAFYRRVSIKTLADAISSLPQVKRVAIKS